MNDSIELTTIGRCQVQILSTFRNNLEDIALFMRSEGIINKKFHHEVIDKSRLSDDDRAGILLRKWEDKVEEDTKHYHKVVEYFKSRPGHFEAVLTKLNTEYPSSAAIAPRTGTRTELTDDHYGKIIDQLIPVKSQWERIALELGFKAYEIKNIASSLVRIQSGDFIHDVITTWLQWGPGDKRGSKDVATLEALQKALNNTNNARIKLKL